MLHSSHTRGDLWVCVTLSIFIFQIRGLAALMQINLPQNNRKFNVHLSLSSCFSWLSSFLYSSHTLSISLSSFRFLQMIASIAAANNPLSLLARSVKASKFIFNHHFHRRFFASSSSSPSTPNSLSKSRRARRGHVNFVLHQFRETFVFLLLSLSFGCYP